ncbi:MAG: carboxypeptidase regulatory-like domain-containing protein [Firmicutes bacterium]|nr:carboxypeptidase regulatory-like domain-containing protein [Bacillota bacterium]
MYLRGQIVDRDTGQSLEGVLVECCGNQGCFHTYSNRRGRFQLKDLRPGHWSVAIVRPPYTENYSQCFVGKQDVFIARSLELPGLDDDPAVTG